MMTYVITLIMTVMMKRLGFEPGRSL